MPSSLTLPTILQQPFAHAGTKNTIPVAPSPTPGLASYDEGFPPETMIPLISGGVPPDGDDFNGVLFDVTAMLRWLNAGCPMPFSSALATAISGYPVGALVKTANHGIVQNTVDGNSNDPDTSMTGWIYYAGTQGIKALWCGNTGGTANAITVTPPSGLGPYEAGQVLLFNYTLAGNTGAVTIDDGRGPVDLRNNNNGVLLAGDLVSGTFYAVVETGLGRYRLLAPVTSQITSSINKTVTVGNAASTSGNAALMMGANARITPRLTGKVLVTVIGKFYPSATAVDESLLYLGTGTAPAPGDAALGYMGQGFGAVFGSDPTTAYPPFFVMAYELTGLVLGTDYWIDASYGNLTTGNAGLSNTTFILEELP